ncbi:MAG: hypothetical protein ABI972_03885 [Acidobacteriota bacterium]
MLVRKFVGLLALSALALALPAAEMTASLKAGKAGLQSAGVLAFGPDGILFVGDSTGGAVWALDTSDRKASAAKPIEIAAANQKIAAMLGTAPDQILINDMAVNPLSKHVYFSVSRGLGPDAAAVILRTNAKGELEELALENIKFSKAAIPDVPDPSQKDRRGQSFRMEAITDIGFMDGKVFIAGLSNQEFSSSLRAIPFPFTSVSAGTSVEIYHGSHGRFETNSPVRTFVPYESKKNQYILAAYTCTPLVKVPVSDLKPGAKVMGTTIAELGNRNRPLDMIVYSKSGKEYILMNNSSRGVMKMGTEKLEAMQSITAPVEDKAGLPYETIAELKGVQQLDSFDGGHAVVLMDGVNGAMDLKTIALP